MMRTTARKRKEDPLNKRLDLLLKDLEISEDKRKKIVEYFENLTFEQVKRLRKS